MKLKKIYFVISIVVMINLVFIGCEKQNTVIKDSIIEEKDNEYGISDNSLNGDYNIICPESWTELDPSDYNAEFVILTDFEDELDTFQENINLIIQNLSENQMNLDSYLDLSLEQIRNNDDFELIESSESVLGGFEARKIIYKTSFEQLGDENSLQLMQIFTIINNKAYLITYTAEPSSYDKYMNEVNEVINSFSLK